MARFLQFDAARARAWLAVLAVLAAAASVSAVLTPAIRAARTDGVLEEEMVYFPSGAFLDEVSGGQDELIADYLWLRAVQYYGSHRQTDRQYVWAKHIFDVITALNPRFVEAYRFGGLVLATDVLDLRAGIDLLKRGFHANPDAWEIPFDIGFLQYLFHEDLLAATYFRRAAAIPGASEQAQRFAAFALRRGGREGGAREMWMQIRDAATNPATREIAEYALRDMELTETLGAVRAGAEAFFAREGRWPVSVREMVSTGTLARLPADPFGRGFLIDPASGQVYSIFKAEETVSQTVIAVEKTLLEYRKDHGAYPASLDALTSEGYMTRIVMPEGFSLALVPGTGKVTVRAPKLFRDVWQGG